MDGGGGERINLYNILKQREERNLGLRLIQWRINSRVRAKYEKAMDAVANYVPAATLALSGSGVAVNSTSTTQ
jgi:hypothetical protein